MATIDFQILNNSDATPSVETLSGSGLGFFGASAGSSVQIGSYQARTNISSANGATIGSSVTNIKYVGDTFPSGMCEVDHTGPAYSVGLSGVPSFQSTVGIRFGHTSAVKVQNCQLRVYDRSYINAPASGVNTKVAEIVNFGGSTYTSQGSAGVSSPVVGSGDAFWWGEPWPAELVTKNYYTNSLGTVFYNGLDSSSAVNGDARLGAYTGDDETVGGSGLVVPLLDSPGSGQKGLQASEVVSGTGLVWPKWTQYLTSSSNQLTWHSSAVQFGDGSSSTNLPRTYGGTGVDTHHTWAIALSASPLSLGSKEQYGLYVSLEYL
jgi:hypothetical protein